MVEGKLVRKEVYLYLDLSPAVAKRFEKLQAFGLTNSRIGSAAFEHFLRLPTEELLNALGVSADLSLEEVKAE